MNAPNIGVSSFRTVQHFYFFSVVLSLAAVFGVGERTSTAHTLPSCISQAITTDVAFLHLIIKLRVCSVSSIIIRSWLDLIPPHAVRVLCRLCLSCMFDYVGTPELRLLN